MRGWIRDVEASGEFGLQGCASGDAFLTQGLRCSAQGFAGESGDVLTGMYLQGRIFNAGFAGFCAGFRRDERGFANRDVLTGTHF